MTVSSAITDALAPLRDMLSADGYELSIREERHDALVAQIIAGPDACAECLVPKEMMRTYFEAALRTALGGGMPDVELIYPTDVYT